MDGTIEHFAPLQHALIVYNVGREIFMVKCSHH